MITREDAAKLVQYNDLGDRYTGVLDLAETVVALYDENATILTNTERIAAGYAEERAALEARLRLAEASVALLRADLAQQAEEAQEHEAWVSELSAVALDEETLEETLGRCIDSLSEAGDLAVDLEAARLELRRLRAAEAPGTDDEAVSEWRDETMRPMPHESFGESPSWTHFADGVRYLVRRGCLDEEHDSGPLVWRWIGHPKGGTGQWSAPFRFALDAMRAAVPGRV